ncbi:MAG TPA: hypothetical protein VGP64_06800 [Polyangia bacterium]|jgi:hypothetical protein
MSIRSRPLLLAIALALPLAFAATCATTGARKYPARPGGCKLRVFHGPPEVKEWDDLGIAHVDCQLDLGRVQCLQRLKMEACRLGADILYDVPQKPLRPTDQGMVYTGHVAHTKVSDGGGVGPGEEKEPDGGAAADESSFEKSVPVEPIAPVVAPPANTNHASPNSPASPVSLARDGGPG